MPNKAWIQLLGWSVVFEVIGYFLGMLTQANIAPWYNSLTKSQLTPPGWVFGSVWSLLYLLLAIVGCQLWRQRFRPEVRKAWYFYVGQLVMNWAWTPLFFEFHWLGFSLGWILLLIVLTLLTLYSLKNTNLKVGWLLIPYVLWLLFAAYLNAVIWMRN